MSIASDIQEFELVNDNEIVEHLIDDEAQKLDASNNNNMNSSLNLDLTAQDEHILNHELIPSSPIPQHKPEQSMIDQLKEQSQEPILTQLSHQSNDSNIVNETTEIAKPKSQLKRSFSAKPLTSGTGAKFRQAYSRLDNSNNHNFFSTNNDTPSPPSLNTSIYITHVTLNLDIANINANKPSIPSWKYTNIRRNCSNYNYSTIYNNSNNKSATQVRKGSFLSRPQTANFLNSNENKNFFLTTSNYINDLTNVTGIANINTTTSNHIDSNSNKNSSNTSTNFRPKSAFIKQKHNRITASISSNEQDSLKEVDGDSVHDESNNSNNSHHQDQEQEKDHNNEHDQDQIELDLQENDNYYNINNQATNRRSLTSPVQQLQLITEQFNSSKMMPPYVMPTLNHRMSSAVIQRATSSTSTKAASRFKAAYDQRTQKMRSKSPYSVSKSTVQPIESYRAPKSSNGYAYENSIASSSMESHRSIGRHTFTTADFNKFKNKLLKNHPRMGYFNSFASYNDANAIIDNNTSNLNYNTVSNKKQQQQPHQLSTSQIKSIYDTIQHQTLVNNINLNNNNQNNKAKSAVELKRSNYLNHIKQTQNFLSSSLVIKKLN